MPLYNKQQQQAIIKAIRDRMNAFIAEVYGQETLPESALQELKARGLIDESITADMVGDSFALGRLQAYLKEAEWKNLTHKQLMDKINTIEMSQLDKHVLENLRTESLQHITGIRRDIENGIFDRLLGMNRTAMAEDLVTATIRGVLEEGFKKKFTHDKIASELGKATGNWERNWSRVARTEIWNSINHGVAQSIINGDGGYQHADGVKSNVARVPSPDACPDCLRLFTGSDGEPKVFQLDELIKNGTNVGKKRAAWAPVVGPVHPACYCQLVYVPSNWHFEDGVLKPIT